MKKPTRPKSRPTAPTRSKRPPKSMPKFDAPSPREEEPVKKKAAGGTVRGMGAAKRGGKFTRSA